MSADKSFRGTLLLLQNKTKRDPEAYVDEFRTQLKYFEAVSKAMLAGSSTGASKTDVTSASNPQFLAVMQFVCHCASCYPQECKALPEHLIELLRQGKDSLAPDTRITIVNCLLLLRNKNIASAELTLPVLFQLLEARDKSLRRIILAHVVSDVRRINLPGSKEGSAHVNKQIQNFLFKVMEDDDAVQARSALTVMIDLYRRQLWCNEKTVQVISKACFSRHTLVLRMALHFFLMQMPKFSSVGTDEDEEDSIDPGRLISKLKHKIKHKAKTVKRERVLKNKVDTLKKRFDKERQAEKAMEKQHVDPVRLLQDPQGFAERLLARLNKTAERFEVRILFMSVLARVISEHELVVLAVFPLLERYLEPTQLHSTNILALASTCVHRMVPPDALEGFVRTVADRFVNDRSDQDSITIGINTIREICKRQPLAMNADLLADLVSYKQRRGERGVIMAARALMQLYREVNPELLPAKLRGSAKTGAPTDVKPPKFGADAPLYEIPGLEALFGPAGDDDVANTDDLEETESENVHFTTDSDDDGSGEWELVTDDSDAEFDESDDDADDDAVPQLVPAKRTVPLPHPTVNDALGSDPEGSGDNDGIHGRTPGDNGFVVEDDMWGESDGELAEAPLKKHRAQSAPSASGDADSADSANETGDDSSEERDEHEDESSGSGEWVDVEHTDDDERDEATDESEDQASGDDAGDESAWIEDVKTKPAAASSVGISTSGKASVATMRTLTDEEFEKLRQLRDGTRAAGKPLKAKALEKQERMSRKDALVRDLGERGQLLNAAKIETFTVRKRATDREAKVEEARQKRMENNPFQARKKKKTKLTTTHREKQKVGKLYQMTKRSSRVAMKIKRSVEERGEHAKEMKKKNIKFRIARGWKA